MPVTNLSVDEDPDDCAVTLHASDVASDADLTQTILPFLCGVHESALLGAMP